jgi:hypothetical protein
MSDQKHNYRSIRRRPQTGRMVLNRRGRILNNTPQQSPEKTHGITKPHDELTVGVADKSVLISENDHNFSMLDQGSFMIFKATKADIDPVMDNSNASSEKKAIKSKIISKKQIDKPYSLEQSATDTSPTETAKAAKTTPKTDEKVGSDEISSTVIPLRIHNRRTSSDAPPNFQPVASSQSVADESQAISPAPKTDHPNHLSDKDIVADASKTPPEDALSESAPIAESTISDETILTDSDAQTDSAPNMDTADDQILRNWHIGAEIGATINAIVADELGKQVRRITRSVVRDMLRDGTLDIGQKD